MNSAALKAILLTCLFLSGISHAEDNNIQADVAISTQQVEDIWMGQQLILNIDLKTTGFSFSDTNFKLPEVAGAFLMQIDTTTVKMTENIEGQSWQIIRYPLALFPQTPGLLEIPPITVRFSSAAGFGSEKKAFEFQTKKLQLRIKAPPGIQEGAMLISTTAFKLEYEWQPELQTEITAAQTGDAFTLTLKREAGDISAMLLPPLPIYRVEGLAAYPQAPEINDKTNRGTLTGERSDSIIWVAEKPGDYSIPGIRFQWWDPAARELKQQVVPGLELDVQPAAVASSKADATAHSSLTKFYLPAGVLIAIITALFWRRFRSRVAGSPIASEKSTFHTLTTACKNNLPAEVYSALHDWLSQCSPMRLTLEEFAKNQADPLLSTELLVLQETLILPQASWQGSELLRALKRAKEQLKQDGIESSKSQLQSLNPV